MRGLFCVAALALAAIGLGQLTPAEKKGLADAMLIGNLAPTDFSKPSLRPAAPYCFPINDTAITNPLQGIDDLLSLHSKASSLTAIGLLEAARHNVFGDTLSPEPPSGSFVVQLPSSIPDDLKPPISMLVSAVTEANESVRKALSKLTPAERRILIDSLPQFATGEPFLKISFVKQPQAAPETILALLEKVDLPAIRLASVKLTGEVQADVPRLKELSKQTGFTGNVKAVTDGIVIEISGTGDDIHDTSNSMLCIDLGGHNRYNGRYAAGVGYASVLIDLGDSDFDVPDLSVGAGLLGIGVAYVGRANDDFRGQSLCFGAGLAGVGVFLKEGGSDTYHATSMCEGFGMFGIGLMIDNGTDKRYEAAAYGQGAARTQGFGWLISRATRSSFSSAGVHGRSCSQGYGAGYPEVAGGLSGGLGMVTQVGGRADYLGSRQCQSFGSWHGVGSICDTGGSSSLKATGEAQAYAAISGGAFQFELGASNALVSSGPGCHAVASNDGAAVLVARGGGDLFAASEYRAGSGIGIFLESGPDNRYLGSPGNQNGLFVDLGGSSRYPSGLSNGESYVERGAVVLAAEGHAMAHTNVELKPGSAARPSDKELETLFAASVQGSDQDALAHLIAVGKPALDWMLNTKLKGATYPALAVMAAVAEGIGDDAAAMLSARIASENDLEASNALEVAVIARLQGVMTAVPAALKRPGVEAVAARAVGVLHLADLTSDLMGLTVSQDPVTALNAMKSLADIGDPKTVSTGQALLGSPTLALRQAAEDLVARYPDQAIEAAKTLFQKPEEVPQRTAIELLGKVGTSAALDMIGPLLDARNPGVKIQAMLALDGRCPAAFRATLVALRRDSDERVRAVAFHVDPGR